MFKKASHIILSMLLLITTIGLAISKHYCGGELVSTRLFAEAESCCNSADCCKNESKTYQLDEDLAVASNLELPESIQLDLFVEAVVLFDAQFEENLNRKEFIITDLPPPPKIKTALSQRQTYLL